MLVALAFLFIACRKKKQYRLAQLYYHYIKTFFMQQGSLQGGQREKATGGNKTRPGDDRNLEQEKVAGKNDSDTEPDEFIAPNADTDQPLEGKGIVNDAVLGGEDHGNPIAEKKQERKK